MALASLEEAEKLLHSVITSSELYFSRNMRKIQKQVTDVQD